MDDKLKIITPNHCNFSMRFKLCNWWLALIVLSVLLLSGCNPKAIPTVIFPAKPKLPPPPAPVAVTVTTPAPVVKEEPKPINVTVNLFARDIVNPDKNGLASPVQLRLYLTNNITALSKATFEQVFEFGDQKFELQPVAITTLRPGSVTSIKLSVEPQHKMLAAAAAFQDIGKSKWLETVSVTTLDSPNINFSLSDYVVTHEKPD